MRRRLAALAVALAAAGAVAGAAWLDSAPKLATLKAQYRRPAAIPGTGQPQLQAARAELGQALFFDPRLSASNTLSCATCHNPALGWEDGKRRSVGEAGSDLARHTPTLWNLAWEETFFWDGRAQSLEEQALGPIESPLEMNQPMDELAAELAQVPGYRTLFAAAFPSAPRVEPAHITQALASFQRTLVSPQTAFDYWIAGDESAIAAPAKRGFVLFNGKARCAECHSGWDFTDRAFHDIGLPDADLGRGPVIGLAEINHGFKTPTLRDLSRRAPYMHDGSLATLEAVIEHYDSGFTQRPTLAQEMQPLNLSETEKTELTAFLRTLDSSTTPPQALAPELPQ